MLNLWKNSRAYHADHKLILVDSFMELYMLFSLFFCLIIPFKASVNEFRF
jgi:hypothetical protein